MAAGAPAVKALPIGGDPPTPQGGCTASVACRRLQLAGIIGPARTASCRFPHPCGTRPFRESPLLIPAQPISDFEAASPGHAGTAGAAVGSVTTEQGVTSPFDIPTRRPTFQQRSPHVVACTSARALLRWQLDEWGVRGPSPFSVRNARVQVEPPAGPCWLGGPSVGVAKVGPGWGRLLTGPRCRPRLSGPWGPETRAKHGDRRRRSLRLAVRAVGRPRPAAGLAT